MTVRKVIGFPFRFVLALVVGVFFFIPTLIGSYIFQPDARYAADKAELIGMSKMILFISNEETSDV